MELFQETIRLFELYREEAAKCREANAPLAGCVALASALEAALLIMVRCFPEDIHNFKKTCHSKEFQRPVKDWGLSQLISAAKHLEWLPSSHQDIDQLDPDRAQVGDYVELVRIIRNFVHPSIYLREYVGERITEKHLDLSFTVLDVACAHLASRLKETLEKDRRREGKSGNRTT